MATRKNQTTPPPGIDFGPLYAAFQEIAKEAESALSGDLAADARTVFADALDRMTEAATVPGAFPAKKMFDILYELLLMGYFSSDPGTAQERTRHAQELLDAAIDTIPNPEAAALMKQTARKAMAQVTADQKLFDTFRKKLEEVQQLTFPDTTLDALLSEAFGGGSWEGESRFAELILTAARQAFLETLSKDRPITNSAGEEPTDGTDAARRLAERFNLSQFGQESGGPAIVHPDRYTYFALKLLKAAQNPRFIDKSKTGLQPVSIYQDEKIRALIRTPDGKPLSDFEEYVLDLVYSHILEAYSTGAAQVIITSADLFRYAKQKYGRVSDAGIRDYEAALAKLRDSTFEADISKHFSAIAASRHLKDEEAEQLIQELKATLEQMIGTPIRDNVTIGGSLIPFDDTFLRAEKKSNGEQITIYTYSLYKRSITAGQLPRLNKPRLLAYSELVNQLKHFPEDFLTIREIKGGRAQAIIPITTERAGIRRYLLARLFQASTPTATIRDCTITCEALYSRYGCADLNPDTTKTKKKRIRDFVSLVLDYWKWYYKENGTIGLHSYTIRKKGKAIDAFVITVGKEKLAGPK